MNLLDRRRIGENVLFRFLAIATFLFLFTIEAQETTWAPTDLKSHSTRWVKYDQEGNTIGSFLEIQTGLNRQFQDGTWGRASEAVEVFEGGGRIRNAQYNGVFSSMSDDPNGTFDIDLPQNGGKFRGRCVGLVYTETTTGTSIFIAQLKSVQGLLFGTNLIAYRDCFTGVSADLVYRARLGGVSQDVILRGKVPPPSNYNLDPANTKLEVWTQVIDAPNAQKYEFPSRSAKGKPIEDCTLDFGPMQIGAGRAAPISRIGQLDLNAEVPIHKSYEAVENTQFIIESVYHEDVAPELNALPDAPGAQIDTKRLREALDARTEGSKRKKPISVALLPRTPPNATSKLQASVLRTSRKSFDESPGYLIDFNLSSSMTNFTFQSDETYVASGPVVLNGATVFESASVIKFTPNTSAQLTIAAGGTVTFPPTNAYANVVFCASDDHSVGFVLNTNVISGYYAESALNFTPTANLTTNIFRNLRISDAKRGLAINGSGSNYTLLAHSQFLHCREAVKADGTVIFARNLLFTGTPSVQSDTTRTTTNFVLTSTTLNAEHLTVDNCSQFLQTNTATISITNSLLINITNMGAAFTSVGNYTNSSSAGLFEASAAGKYYLPSGSTLRDVGSTNINPELAMELRLRTTGAPLFLTNRVTVDSVWPPRVTGDFGAPDLGFHYLPLDYIVDFVVVTNATLTLTNGVRIGTLHGYGIQFYDRGVLVSVGSPVTPNRFVDYSLVQEQPIRIERSSSYPPLTLSGYAPSGVGTNAATIRFTEFIGGPSRYHFYQEGDFLFRTLNVRDSAFNNGIMRLRGINGGLASPSFVNNLFLRTSFSVSGNETYGFYNNLFRVGTFQANSSSANQFTFKDNAFDGQTNFGFQIQNITTSSNAYINTSARLKPLSDSGIVVSSLQYTNGPLGSFYQATTNLINVGSRPASDAGLYHFTLQDSLTKETSTTVDVGYHYVATDAQGVPIDGDGDGIPDYLEDANGNGIEDSTELPWTAALSGTGGLTVFTPLQP